MSYGESQVLWSLVAGVGGIVLGALLLTFVVFPLLNRWF